MVDVTALCYFEVELPGLRTVLEFVSVCFNWGLLLNYNLKKTFLLGPDGKVDG